ncbi:MAG: flagellar hook protein FlgE [Clostridia bacterium]|nr:flagellar hook protein FlgE [Clostridia bacterium]
MLRSLYAGVSGLSNHQTRLDVIGNNIANVNTVGFKKSRVLFQDMLSQTLRGASSPTEDCGGTNACQIGTGVTVAFIDVIHTDGSPQPTGKNTDLSIEGEGLFMLGNGDNVYYTRAGSFDFDYNMSLVNKANGMYVKGIMADENGVIDPEGEIANLNFISQVSSPPHATTKVEFGKNIDFNAVVQTGTDATAHINGGVTTVTLTLPINNVLVKDSGGIPLTEDVANGYTVDYTTGEVTIGTGVADGDYTITYYTPNYSNSVTVYDSKGNSHVVDVYYTKIADNEWKVDTAIEGNFIPSGKGELSFDATSGKLKSTSSKVINVEKPIAGASDLSFDLDFTNLTEYANGFTVTYTSQDGYKAGNLLDMEFDTSGTINGSYSNGQRRKLAQLVTASFANPAGLVKNGNNLYRASNNSGDANTGVPGTAGHGIVKPETLEMSNVDLSQEFVDMIVTQRGFQANSRVITTSDQILEELVNLKR